VLDYLLFCYLESKLSAEEIVPLKKWHLSERLERVRDIIAAGCHPATQQQSFEDFYKRVDPIRKIRNHIAHGHILFRVADDGKSCTFGIARARDLDVGGEPETRCLTLAELETYSRELVALIELFQPFAGFQEER
jgi:hypothetical protein